MSKRIVILKRTTTVTLSVEVDASEPDREAAARERIEDDGWQHFAHADEETTLTLEDIR